MHSDSKIPKNIQKYFSQIRQKATDKYDFSRYSCSGYPHLNIIKQLLAERMQK